MGSFYGKKFDKVVRMLRKEFPLGVLTTVKTVKKLRCKDGGELLYGQCSSSENSKGVVNKFVIEVDRDLPLGLAIDTLLHEWAHATDYLKNGHPVAHPHRTAGECITLAFGELTRGRNDSLTWPIEMMGLFFTLASFLVVAAFFVGRDLAR